MTVQALLRPLCVLVLLGICGSPQAARLNETRLFGGPGVDVGNSVRAVPGGGYAVVGYTGGPDGTRRDAWLLRLDERLDTLWSRRYGGAGERYAWDLAPTPDSGFLIAGFQQTPAGDEDVWLARVDDTGALLWERSFGGPGRDRAWALAPLAGGDALVLAETTSFGEGAEDVYLLRIGPTGDTVWARHAGGSGTDRAFAIAGRGDGALIIGMSNSGASGLRVLLGWVTADGRIRLERLAGGPGNDIGHGITSLPGGGFLVTGYSSSGPSASNDVMLLHLDSAGRETGRQLLDAPGDERAMMSAVSPDGRTATVGYSQRDGDWDLALYLGTPRDPAAVRWRDHRPGDARGVMVAPFAGDAWVVTGTQVVGRDRGQLLISSVIPR